MRQTEEWIDKSMLNAACHVYDGDILMTYTSVTLTTSPASRPTMYDEIVKSIVNKIKSSKYEFYT